MSDKGGALTIEVDPDALTIDDLPVLVGVGEFAEGGFTRPRLEELLDVLDRVVIGGVRGQGYRISDFSAIVAGVMDAINAPGTDAAKN